MKQQGKAHLALIISGLLFGANYWIAKGLMPAFSPFQIVGIRIFITTALLWIAGFFFKSETRFSRKDLIIILLAGITGVSVNQFFFFAGLEHSSPVETSILHTLSPMVVAFFAFWFLKEKIGWRKFAGIIAGFTGAFIIVASGEELSVNNLHLRGNLYIILNIISYSLYIIILKPLMNNHHSLHVLKYVFLAGCITYLPSLLIFPADTSFAHVTTVEWFSLTYVVIGSTFLTYLLTIFSIKRLPASVIGFYIYMQPFIASVIGYVTGKEKLTVQDTIAAVFLFAGVWLVLGKKG